AAPQAAPGEAGGGGGGRAGGDPAGRPPQPRPRDRAAGEAAEAVRFEPLEAELAFAVLELARRPAERSLGFRDSGFLWCHVDVKLRRSSIVSQTAPGSAGRNKIESRARRGGLLERRREITGPALH